MAEDSLPASSTQTPREGRSGRLESWKEIATYLNRDVSTVQRWERREGMPVHRHRHDKLGSVYASTTELDAWWSNRNVRLDRDTAIPIDTPPSGRASSNARRFPLLWATLAASVAAVVAGVWVLDPEESSWQNPISDARFQQLTDFDGSEHAAAVSRDGQFVAFLSDRAGALDVWVSQVGSGQFYNLTRGAAHELDNPDVRTVGFSPDGTVVSMWLRKSSATNPADISVWGVPTLGGEPRPYLEGIAEFDWSADGTRLVYHTPGPGDPLFVRDSADRPARQIWAAPSGQHAHFPVWSPDSRFIYFVYGTLPDKLDIWRIGEGGGSPERITFHQSRVSHPVFLNPTTLLYLATAADDRGPSIYGLDVERREAHRLSSGVERYTSLAASTDRRRLVATVAHQSGTLWRVAIAENASEKPVPHRITLPTTRGRAPRYGRNYLLYVSERSETESLWKLAGETATELWNVAEARILGGPAIAPDGWRLAFSAEVRGRSRLYTMNADGSALRPVLESLEPRGAPAWAPDGQSVVVPVAVDGEPRLVSVSVDGQKAVSLVSEYSTDPVWSPDGGFLLYSGRDVGTTFQVRAVRADGAPHRFRPLTLSRGARLGFLRGRQGLIVLHGEINHKNFSLLDPETGTERALTDFGRNFIIRDFDIARDGREIVFDQVQENSDIVLIHLK